MMEIWKAIKGYEGYYEVSNLGRIRSLDRIIPDKLRPRKIKGKIITPGEDKPRKGYKHCVLYNRDKKITIRIHRAVAEAFIPNPNNYPIINHKDYNPSNNCVDNLEWCTYKYNSNYGNISEKRGVRVQQLDDNGKVLGTFRSERAAAKSVGVKDNSIAQAIRRKQRCGGYYWKRV